MNLKDEEPHQTEPQFETRAQHNRSTTKTTTEQKTNKHKDIKGEKKKDKTKPKSHKGMSKDSYGKVS